MKLFAIFDQQEQTYFRSKRGKATWGAAGHAKNGWLNDQPNHQRPYHFKDQTRFVVFEVTLQPTSGEPA